MQKIFNLRFYYAIFTIVLSISTLLIGCEKDKNMKLDSPIEVSQQHTLTHNKIVEAKKALNEWHSAALANIEYRKISPKIRSFSDNEPTGRTSVVNDPNFVNFLYHTALGNLNIYDHYSGSMNTTTFNHFVAAAYQENSNLANIFDQYGQSADPFVANMSFVLADAALINYNNTAFNSLTETEQRQVIKDGIDFYFLNDPVIGTPPSGIIISNSLLDEISGCLFDAVGGFLIGNYRIIRELYGAISGSSMGYSFVYAMAGRIMKQAFVNSGGWAGMALGFAWCMIF